MIDINWWPKSSNQSSIDVALRIPINPLFFCLTARCAFLGLCAVRLEAQAAGWGWQAKLPGLVANSLKTQPLTVHVNPTSSGQHQVRLRIWHWVEGDSGQGLPGNTTAEVEEVLSRWGWPKLRCGQTTWPRPPRRWWSGRIWRGASSST